MIKNFVKIILFEILNLIPKNNYILVFGDRAGIRFADNSRYLFFYLNKYNKEFKCIWITKDKKIYKYLNDKGFQCYFHNSLKGLYYALIAKYHIYNFVENDINKFVTYFSNNILLWHGVLPKKLIETKNKLKKSYINKRLKKYFLYPNHKMAQNILNHFQEKKFEFFVSNLPRNILLNRNELNVENYITDQEKNFKKKITEENKTIIGYFPTWRHDGMELFRDIKNLNDLNKLDEYLLKNNSILLIKKHMNSEKKDKNRHYNLEIEKIISHLGNLKSIRNLSFDFDLNSFLDICDILISDYSGVMFDYLYTDKPIITYAPDYDIFKNEVGFSLDPVKEDFTHVAYNLNELIALFNNYFTDKSNFTESFKIERKKVKDKVFVQKDGLEDLINLIKN